MTDAVLNDPRLVPALDRLLPGGEGFPPASALGLAGRLADEPRFARAWAALLDRLPREVGRAELEQAEADAPEVFGAALNAAYSLYYTDPQVLAVMERATGYKAAPPQPGGYALPAFDPEMLAVPAARAALWRDPREEEQ